ncbi:MAG: hypothetical protein BAJALOKI2v1_500004 [Promethearchaeota archaeon]|nr:MAG: hypothetical protein BAJALOKI2v1_500004 [Candidatus Lokiarchaeota archaeon]
MIEEESDEDILEKDRSWKKILKHVVVIFLMILGALFLVVGIGPDIVSNYFIGFMLICFATTLLQIQKEPPEPIKQTLTILECIKCEGKKVRNYKSGDYVYKNTEESCPKCDGPMKIKEIYSVKLKSPTEKEEKPKLKVKDPTGI